MSDGITSIKEKRKEDGKKDRIRWEMKGREKNEFMNWSEKVKWMWDGINSIKHGEKKIWKER